jgi:tetratricopeptide (TPR) repeat protein
VTARWQRGVLGLGLVLAGCGLPGALRREEGTADLIARADTLARSGDFRTAEATYRQVLDMPSRDGRPDPARDRAVLGLGRLYVAPDNPGRDYRQAYQQFDRLARERPDSPEAAEARAWREVLDAAQRQREEALRARQEAERLRRELRRSREEVDAFRQDLDRLKRLELDLERQRRR